MNLIRFLGIIFAENKFFTKNEKVFTLRNLDIHDYIKC